MAELRHQIFIQAKPEAVYAALATQTGLRGWWTADATSEEKAGSEAVFGFDRRATIFRMHIERLERAKSVMWSCHGDQPEWNGTTLTWELAPNNGGTTVRFVHHGWREATELYAICNSSWGELMHRLKNYSEGRNPGPRWTE